MSGKVYIGKKIRGKTQPSIGSAVRVDVTSGSKKLVNGVAASTLSPLKLGPIRHRDIICNVFENFWQYSKVYPQLGHIDSTGNTTEKWRLWRDSGFAQTVGKRTPPAVSTLKQKYRRGEIVAWTPDFAVFDDKKYGYLESRRAIYIPFYHGAIRNLPIIAELKKLVASGTDILIIDVDGPADVLDANEKNIMAALDDPSVPFGHGYIVAAELLGFAEKLYL